MPVQITGPQSPPASIDAGEGEDTLGIAISEETVTPVGVPGAVWTFEIDCETDDGEFRVGRVTTTPALVQGVFSRAIATATWPGAKRWTVTARSSLNSGRVTVMLSTGKSPCGVPGVASVDASGNSFDIARDVPLLAAWYRGDLGLLSTAGAVNAWEDQGPFHAHLFALPAFPPPTVGTLNTKPAPAFDGVAQFAAAADSTRFSFERSDPFWIATAQRIDVQQNGVLLAKQTSAIGNPAAPGYRLEYRAPNVLRVELCHDAGPPNRIRVDFALPAALGATQVLLVQYDGSSSAKGVTASCNGTALVPTVQTDTLTGSILTATGLELATADDVAPWAAYTLGELVIGGGMLNAGLSGMLVRYLREKWGAA